MRSLIVLSTFIAISFSAFGQMNETAPVVIQPKTELRYVIGIGNESDVVYLDCLDYLEHSENIKVYVQ